MPVITAQAPLPTTASIPTDPVAKAIADVSHETIEAAPDPKQEEALSPRFAALAREQKIIRQKQIALKAQEEAFLKKQSDYDTNYIARDKIKSDGVTVLLENGYTMDQIAQVLLSNNAPKDPSITKMEQKILELEAKASEPMKKFEEIQVKQREQAVNNIRNEVKLLVDSDANYETIKEMGAQETVVSYIEKIFDETGELLTVADASSKIEEELLQRAIKFASLKKVQSKLPNPLLEAQKQQLVQKQSQPNSPIKTLTNAATAVPSKPRTAAERIARAKAAFSGQPMT